MRFSFSTKWEKVIEGQIKTKQKLRRKEEKFKMPINTLAYLQVVEERFFYFFFFANETQSWRGDNCPF